MRTGARSACLPCRSKKIRCTGNGQPCTTCIERRSVTECEFTKEESDNLRKESQRSQLKRPISVFNEAPLGEDDYRLMAPSRPLDLHYDHYALIYLDRDGKLNVDESHSVREQNSTLFTPDVRQNFLAILSERVGSHEPISYTLDASSQVAKCRRVNEPGSSVSDNCLGDQILGTDSSESSDLISLRLGETQKIRRYYEKTMEHFKQANCRVLAKAFIKFIEPHKQTRHPYNGGGDRDSEKTKPGWWPPDVIHKEPDHLGKEHRMKLLLHIICKLGEYDITADKLMQVVSGTKQSLKDPSHIEMIYEILRVRKMEERFERGEVDSDTLVYIMNRRRNFLTHNEMSTEETSVTPEVCEERPTLPVSQRASNLTPSINAMPHAVSALPNHFSNPETIFSTPFDYMGYPMQSMPYTTGTEQISPHYTLVSDYANEKPFSAPTPGHLPTTFTLP